jgi:hypothetical protein
MEKNQKLIEAIFSHHAQLFHMDIHHQNYEIIILGISTHKIKICLTINIKFYT